MEEAIAVFFVQWAAAKYLRPALKTIVSLRVAAIPGFGLLPMENNIFLNANYGWAFLSLMINILTMKLITTLSAGTRYTKESVCKWCCLPEN